MDAPIVLRRRGLGGILLRGSRVRLDPAESRIDFGGPSMDLKDLRHLEVERGFLNLGTDRHWETIDLLRCTCGRVPLVSRGALSPAGVLLIETLKGAIARNREAALARAAADPTGTPGSPAEVTGDGVQRFDFRFLVRLDKMAVILTVASVVLLLLDLYKTSHTWIISWPETVGFLIFLLLGTAALYYRRGVSRLRFDVEGVTRKGVFGSRFNPWSEVREFRRQHGEMEFAGQGFRLGVSLEVLAAGGTPLVLRRGRTAMLTLPGRLFLDWLRGRIPEVVEPAIRLPVNERRWTRWWIGTLVAVNTIIFLAERPYSEEDFLDRLIAMGARTEDWQREPWRLVTSLFLHGSAFHLVTNMFALAVMGPWMGWIFGWPRTLVLYLASGTLGNLIGECLSRSESHTAVGASTAIMGLLGALLGITYRRPERIPLAARARLRWAIPLVLILTLGMGLAIPVLDNGAHMGGFFAGLVFAWVLPPKKD